MCIHNNTPYTCIELREKKPPAKIILKKRKKIAKTIDKLKNKLYIKYVSVKDSHGKGKAVAMNKRQGNREGKVSGKGGLE